MNTYCSKQFQKLFQNDENAAYEYFIERCRKGADIQQIIDMIEIGIDPRKNNDNAFIKSCCSDNIKLVQFFIDNGANINASYGNALINAAFLSRWDVFRLLLDNNINIDNTIINSLLKYVGKENSDIAFKIILEYSNIDKEKFCSDFFSAVNLNKHCNKIKYLYDHNLDVNQILYNFINNNKN